MNNQKRKNIVTGIIAILLILSIVLAIMLYQSKKTYKTSSMNEYNMAFCELVDYMENVENYLAKSLISTSSTQGAETLTHVWREANLAQTYLSMLPIETQELENTQKFLNQVSDYSYSLSRKNINNQDLTEDDLNHLQELHQYSVELSNTINQLSEDINSGRISWKELTKKNNLAFAQQVSNISKDSFSNLEENFHEYSGLIYDGAYSDHITSQEKKGLTGEDIEEEQAKNIVEEFIGKDNIKEVSSFGYSEGADIPVYNFSVKTNQDENVSIAISKKGGHIVDMNSDRIVETEIISQEEANEIGKKFLTEKGFPNMKETYYLKQEGIVTVNYAYEQNGVIMYPDLVKVKIALDNGQILGLESTGYLNSHCERDISNVQITIDQAKEKLNKKLDIASQGLAVIPTEWKSEILCYEFKGKVDESEFLVYINAQTGNEEDILIITNTPNGTLAM